MRRILLTLLVATCLAVPRAQERALVLSQLTWFDRAGHRLSTIGPLADHGNLELSPDGGRVAVAVGDREQGTHDIWIYDAKGGRVQFTSDPADENWMIWSPDGRRAALNSFAATRLALVERPSDGRGAGVDLLVDSAGKWPVSWSPDGRNILYVTSTPATGNDIWVLPLTGSRRPAAFLDTNASENWPAFSPDGRYVAYSSTEPTGDAEVYVAPFEPNGRIWRISAEGGTQARWRTPNEILYVAPDRRLMSATVRVVDNNLVVARIEALFTLTYPYGAYHAFDVPKDGQRILVNTLIVSPGAPTLSASARP